MATAIWKKKIWSPALVYSASGTVSSRTSHSSLVLHVLRATLDLGLLKTTVLPS